HDGRLHSHPFGSRDRHGLGASDSRSPDYLRGRCMKHERDQKTADKALLTQLHQVQVSEVMTTSPVIVSPELSVATAERLALDHSVRYLLVSTSGELLGTTC